MSVRKATVLDVVGVCKNYPNLQTSRQKLALVWARLLGREPTNTLPILHDVNFSVLRGESLGLVGVNGAGKSTLLKMIAGVVAPTKGHISRNGRIAALLELGAGFHPEYTGRENVFLACALMGLPKVQVEEKLASIIEFADIGVYIDQPIKHYSSGMVVRLGFAVATSVTPDVLITDEVLAVGDESFQKKCVAWMEAYLANGGTLLLCSHSMYHIQKLCKHALWIDSGRVFMQGKADDVARAYLTWHEEKARKALPELNEAGPSKGEGGGGLYCIERLLLNGKPASQSLVVEMGQDLTLAGHVRSPDGRTPNVAVAIVRADGTPIYGVVSEMDAHVLQYDEIENAFQFEIVFQRLPLLPGNYVARAHAMDPEGLRLFDQMEQTFTVSGSARELGLCRLEHQWTTK